MKLLGTIIATTAVAILLSGCANAPHEQRTATGAVLGGATGLLSAMLSVVVLAVHFWVLELAPCLELRSPTRPIPTTMVRGCVVIAIRTAVSTLRSVTSATIGAYMATTVVGATAGDSPSTYRHRYGLALGSWLGIRAVV